MIAIRHARLPDDAAAIEAIDTSFSTDIVFDVEADGGGFALRERRLAAPLTKRFPLDDVRSDERPWSHGFVAEDGGVCVGFAAAGFGAWNRRLVLWHLYVRADARGRGVGRRLVERVADLGRELGARHIWLETSNLNAPGVAAYRALGFTLTGVDTTLYDATPAEGEIALFFSRPLPSPSASAAWRAVDSHP
jgi:ribosomal protein S18 acetylase RimI-like enzyme